MARASAVYVVLEGGKPPAGFTVKHELVTWLGRHEAPATLAIWRVPDGPYKTREGVRVPVGELIDLPPPA